MNENKKPVCLTIAGLDPSGGAGVIADVRAFDHFGCFPTAAITSVTFQNTTGVFGATHMSPDDVLRQIEAVADDLDILAVKTGMLPTGAIIETIAEIIRERSFKHLVVDPVVRSTSGYDLIDNEALRVLVDKLFPLADLITPNIPEAERITGVAIDSVEDIHSAAQIMLASGARRVLIKGGHFANGGSDRRAVDRLYTANGIQEFAAEFIDTTATHGTGCTLASSITAKMALGAGITDSIGVAKEFVTNSIRTAPMLGHGNSPIR